jgi:cytosine/uracil/thiamine/allantoin permease
MILVTSIQSLRRPMQLYFSGEVLYLLLVMYISVLSPLEGVIQILADNYVLQQQH